MNDVMTETPQRRPHWWRRHELQINMVLTVVFFIVFIASVVLRNGMVAGPSLLLTIFFATYTIYGYVRR